MAAENQLRRIEVLEQQVPEVLAKQTALLHHQVQMEARFELKLESFCETLRDQLMMALKKQLSGSSGKALKEPSAGASDFDLKMGFSENLGFCSNQRKLIELSDMCEVTLNCSCCDVCVDNNMSGIPEDKDDASGEEFVMALDNPGLDTAVGVADESVEVVGEKLENDGSVGQEIGLLNQGDGLGAQDLVVKEAGGELSEVQEQVVSKLAVDVPLSLSLPLPLPLPLPLLYQYSLLCADNRRWKVYVTGEKMELFYYMGIEGLTVVGAVLELNKGNKNQINTSSAFNAFKNNYLLVYSLMMAGDWLQGPFVYYMYTTYGYGKGEIGQLFITGFGSSMLFGTSVGSLADKQGRKRACVTYCITYILSCIAKHSPQYKILMLGRILGGIATSLLFSAFESWLVVEHFKRGFDQPWLSIIFSKAIFLAIGMAVILSSWSENFRDPSESKDLLTQFKDAVVAITSDETIALFGAIQSLFDGSMYTFVFLWTPALSPNDEDIPHGFIFATFMLASMLGSSIVARLLACNAIRVESYMQLVFVISSASLMLPILTNFLVPTSTVKGDGISFAGYLQLLERHVSAMLGKGFMMLMVGKRIEDLQRMYTLFLYGECP